MHWPPNVLGSIGLPTVSTNPSGNAWNTTHDAPVVGSYGMNKNTDAAIYNSYTMAPPNSGVVNNTNMTYAQQPPIIAIGGPTYTCADQNMYSQP